MELKIPSFAFVFLFSFFAKAQHYENRPDFVPFNGGSAQAMDVKAADIDGDGDLDILLANEFQPNVILLNDGNGKLTNGTLGKLPQPNHDSEDVIAEDFDKDGDPDLIFCSEDDFGLGRTNVHEYYLNDGKGNFSEAPYRFADSEANAVIATDINHDGNLDVLFGNNGPIGVYIGIGDGTFREENNRFPSIHKTTQDLLAFDADGDGDTDILEGNENGNVIFINDGTGIFTEETINRLPLPNIETRKVSAGDIDNDGDLDLFLSNVQFIAGRLRQNRLYINDGNGIFTDESLKRIPIDFDHTIDGIFEDSDDDGDLDIVLANVFGGSLKIYENDGNGFYSNKTIENLGGIFTIDALGVISADLNGDGARDLYFCDRNTGTSNKDLLFVKKKLSDTTFPKSSEGKTTIVFPNPSSTGFRIKFEKKALRKLSIYSVDGRMIINLGTFIDSEIFIAKKDLTILAGGTYFLKVETDSDFYYKKLVIGEKH